MLIAGLGNLLMKDDGVGVHVVNALQQRPQQQGIKVAEIGVTVLQALHLLEWADVVLGVDAIQAGGPPGSIYGCCPQDIGRKPVENSLHDVNLAAAVQFIKPEKRPEVLLVGMEPKQISFSLELSEELQQHLEELCNLVQELAIGLRAGDVTVDEAFVGAGMSAHQTTCS